MMMTAWCIRSCIDRDGTIMKDIRRLDKTAFTTFTLSFYSNLLAFTILMSVTTKKKRKFNVTKGKGAKKKKV